METGAEVQAHLNGLHEAVWELAAISLVLGERATTDPSREEAAKRVLLHDGLLVASEAGPQPSPGLSELVSAGATGVAAQAATAITQAAALLSGAAAWSSQDDEAILAQGRASAQGAHPFNMYALPMMDGLGKLISGASPVMLDVGVGVASMAVAFCQVFPGLRIVGLDVFPRALDLARRTVEEAGMADRIDLRQQDIAELDDLDLYCLAWLPAPFLPQAALEAGLPRVVAALVPGGWIALGHGKLNTGGLSGALTRFQSAVFGGTALTDDQAEVLLRRAGLEGVTTLPTPQGAPALTVGRRRTATSGPGRESTSQGL